MTIPEAAHRPVLRPDHAIVVADGDVAARSVLDAAWPGWADGASIVIAADGGYARALGLGLAPSLLVGDLDSVDPALAEAAEAGGVVVRRASRAKDESDAELALLAAVEAGARRITLLGAFGGRRLDHALANLWLLAHPALATTPVVLLDAAARVSLLAAPGPDGAPVTRPLPGPIGAVVTLLPFAGDATGVTTRGLRYPLRDEPLSTGPARGLSNVRVLADAAVTLREGRLLLVETPDEAARPAAGLSSEP
jgi:thiamine pyrophosphokinase